MIAFNISPDKSIVKAWDIIVEPFMKQPIKNQTFGKQLTGDIPLGKTL